MATILDSGIFGAANSLFVFLLMLVVMFAVLKKIKIFGDNDFINAFIAVIASLLFSLSSTAVKAIALATPWIMLLLMIFVFITLIFLFLGAKVTELPIYPVSNPTMVTITIFIIVVIFLFSLGEVTHQQAQVDQGATATTISQGAAASFPAQIGEILRQPAVLGMIITLLIATFSILLISAK